jgi:hypothetical protein
MNTSAIHRYPSPKLEDLPENIRSRMLWVVVAGAHAVLHRLTARGSRISAGDAIVEISSRLPIALHKIQLP